MYVIFNINSFRIITRTDLDWASIYDFVFDRLRSIRQDAVIQRIDITTSILLLEPIVRFHIYAAQRYKLINTHSLKSWKVMK